jgi:hypothetical protein
MAKLKRLINGQDIAFDTHQAGDGRPVRLADLHLEKRLHHGKGKIRYALFGQEEPTSSKRVSKRTEERVTKEVRDALYKNSELKRQLAEAILDALKRFSDGRASVETAKAAAKSIARQFGLDESFLRVVEDYSDTQLLSLRTVHFNLETGSLHEIFQSRDTIEVRKARRNLPLKTIDPRAGEVR